MSTPGPGGALDEQWWTVPEVARFFRVNDQIVRKWIRAGVLPAARTPGGHARVPVASVEALIEAGRE